MIRPMLVMEVSTIILCILRADFFTPTMQMVTQASFAVLFFICRILIVPYIYYTGVFTDMNHNLGSCFPRSLYHITLLFGAFFNGLNLFCKWTELAMHRWSFVRTNNLTFPLSLRLLSRFVLGFYKLSKKIHRKLTGKEAIGNTAR